MNTTTVAAGVLASTAAAVVVQRRQAQRRQDAADRAAILARQTEDCLHWKKIQVRHCPKGNCPVEISYRTFGNPADPAVLLVMGVNRQGVFWGQDFCRQLADQGHHVIIFDHRDVGFSTKFDHMKCAPTWHLFFPQKVMGWKAPYSLVDMAEDGVCLLDKLGIQKAHWVGSSMGGMISQEAAIHFPQKVISLTSIMSTTGNTKLPDMGLSTKLWFLRKPKSQKFEDLLAHKVAFAKAVLCTGVDLTPEDEKHVVAEAKIQLERTIDEEGGVRHMFAIKTAPNRDEALAKLTVPSQVIHGRTDVLFSLKHAEHTAQMLEKSGAFKGLKVIDGMGHGIGPWCSNKVLAELTPFFKHTKQ